jgi:hypothetical protein
MSLTQLASLAGHDGHWPKKYSDMRRDLDLCRQILLSLERDDPNLEIPGYTTEQILYHCVLLEEAGLLLGQFDRGSSGDVIEAMIKRMTWEGHDFLDVARSETHWRKAKDQILKTGGSWTFEIVKSLLVEIAKRSLM